MKTHSRSYGNTTHQSLLRSLLVNSTRFVLAVPLCSPRPIAHPPANNAFLLLLLLSTELYRVMRS